MSKVCHGLCLCLEFNYNEFIGFHWETLCLHVDATLKFTTHLNVAQASARLFSPTRKLHNNIYKTKDCRGIKPISKSVFTQAQHIVRVLTRVESIVSSRGRGIALFV